MEDTNLHHLVLEPVNGSRGRKERVGGGRRRLRDPCGKL